MQSLSKANKRFAVFGCMIMFTLGFEIAGFQAVLLDIAQEFSMNNTQMGMLAAVQSVASVISTLSFGGLADKIRKKKAVALFGCVPGGLFGKRPHDRLQHFRPGAGLFHGGGDDAGNAL